MVLCHWLLDVDLTLLPYRCLLRLQLYLLQLVCSLRRLLCGSIHRGTRHLGYIRACELLTAEIHHVDPLTLEQSSSSK